MVKYGKFETEEKLESLQNSKIQLKDSGNPDGINESIWVKRLSDKKHAVLQNHALALYPFSSWGSVHNIEKGYIDVKELKESEPSIIMLHPEAWEVFVKEKIITRTGNIKSKKEKE